ncbi:MAG TPA: exodeoxyribonuclease V subunit alpha [Polyangiales bacterium]
MSVVRPLHLLCTQLEERAATWLAAGVLVPSDLLVVDAVAPRYLESDPDVLLGLALAVRAPRAGHVGVDLRAVQDRIDDERTRLSEEGDDAERVIDWPTDVVAWEARVLASALVGTAADTDRPFVRQPCNDGRTLLMSRRMWREQERLAEGLRALVSSPPNPAFEREAVERGLARLFEEPQSEAAQAVRTAVRGRLAITTGGPGTGKTYSVKRLLALLLDLTASAPAPLRIELAAPTGKAAVRMKQALEEGLDALSVSVATHSALRALRPQTLHKLLGVRPDGSCRHDRVSPLHADLVVVDEASMVDLVLMRRLVDAVKSGARLVLLGDRDQLASVEVGSVLADLVGEVDVAAHATAAEIALTDSIVRFTRSHRFASAPSVAEVARLIQHKGQAELERAVRLLTGAERLADPMPDRIVHLDDRFPGSEAQRREPTDAQLDALAAPYLAPDGYVGLLAAAIAKHGLSGTALRDPELHRKLLDALESYRVLAVHRRGSRGVAGLDRALAARMRANLEAALRSGASLSSKSAAHLPSSGGHYLGEPVLVTENTYDVGLMNGDIGIVVPTFTSRLAAVFPSYDAANGGCREVALPRLPAHMGAFAMTVHKSQGSQFKRVALVLAGRPSPIETRELIYTAITRTSARLDWLGDPAELAAALARPIQRASGLGELLWPAPRR